MGSYIDKMKREEAEYFNKSAQRRTACGRIPMEADIRRATRFIPTSNEEPIDPRMKNIYEGWFRDKFIDYIARPGGRVLDIGCGPGWLALEFGRRGMFVDAFDISEEAIRVAKQTLENNPYKNGFGKVSYFLQDITQVELGDGVYDAVYGWSALHHLPDLPVFMAHIYRALKPGGIIATMDDLPRGRVEKWLERMFLLLLPTYGGQTYLKKIGRCLRWITGKTVIEAPDFFTPMEAVAAKDIAVFEISDICYNKYEVLWDVNFNAFACGMAKIAGPDWFRYSVERCIVGLDRIFCKIRLCRGWFRIIVARKHV